MSYRTAVDAALSRFRLKFGRGSPIIYAAAGGWPAGRSRDAPRRNPHGRRTTMRINTNVSALNTQRILSQTNTAVARSIGRLSSGYRINRAADDAAGLGIANKMRADLRGLRQAARNAEQANS